MPDERGRGPLPRPERVDGVHGHPGGEGEERHRHQLSRLTVETRHLRRVHVVRFRAQPPEEDEAGSHLHEAVDAEAQEGDAAREEPSRHRHRTFHHVPADGQVLETEGVGEPVAPAVGGECLGVARVHKATRRRRSALAMTETELRLMAAAAIMGERSQPLKG